MLMISPSVSGRSPAKLASLAKNEMTESSGCSRLRSIVFLMWCWNSTPLLAGVDLLVLREPAAERQHPGLGPHLQLRDVLQVEPHHRRDDPHGERDGEVLHELALATADDLVEQLVDHALDQGPPPLGPGHGEEGIDQLAVAPVHRRVDGEVADPGPALLGVDVERPRRHALARRVLGRAPQVQVGATQDGLDVVEPGEHVHVRPRHLPDGSFLAQEVVGGVPVLLGGRIEEVDVVRRGRVTRLARRGAHGRTVWARCRGAPARRYRRQRPAARSASYVAVACSTAARLLCTNTSRAGARPRLGLQRRSGAGPGTAARRGGRTARSCGTWPPARPSREPAGGRRRTRRSTASTAARSARRRPRASRPCRRPTR